MKMNMLDSDLIVFMFFFICIMLSYIAWQVTPRKGGKNERDHK